MAFVYKSWGSVEELFLIVPSFLVAGISVGMFCSLLPFGKPYRSTFIISSIAPLLSGLFFLFINLYINTASAGDWKGGLIQGESQQYYTMFFTFFAFISILFGIVSIFGCFLGKTIQTIAADFYKKKDISNVELKAAKMGSITTIFATLLTALVSISIALIGKSS